MNIMDLWLVWPFHFLVIALNAVIGFWKLYIGRKCFVWVNLAIPLGYYMLKSFRLSMARLLYCSLSFIVRTLLKASTALSRCGSFTYYCFLRMAVMFNLRYLEFLISVEMLGFTERIGYEMASMLEVAENTRILISCKHKQCVTWIHSWRV